MCEGVKEKMEKDYLNKHKDYYLIIGRFTLHTFTLKNFIIHHGECENEKGMEWADKITWTFHLSI